MTALACAAQFWPVAATALNDALATEAGRQAAQKVLGDALAVADAREMALLLSAGDAVEKAERPAAAAGADASTSSWCGRCAKSMTSWSQNMPDVRALCRR